AFCEREYGVDFLLFSKIDVNGKQAHPLYRWLKSQKSGLLGGRITWNFTKFLVARDGTVAARFGPNRRPEDLREAGEGALRGGAGSMRRGPPRWYAARAAGAAGGVASDPRSGTGAILTEV